jgi:predicted nucleic-acid-binding protein
VRAVDTNVVLRWLVEDDPAQTAVARELFEQPVAISLTVFLESAWVLRSRYGFSAEEAATLLARVLELGKVFVADAELVGWALERFSAGADFADMIHLVSVHRHDSFATFDRSIAPAAGVTTPLPIETLR